MRRRSRLTCSRSSPGGAQLHGDRDQMLGHGDDDGDEESLMADADEGEGACADV